MLGTLVVALLLVACAPGTAPVAPAPGGAPAEQAEKIQLLYMTHSFDPAIPVNEQVIQEFQELHPEVEIVYDHTPHANFEQKVLTAFAGGQGPDVFWAGDWMMPQFIKNEIIAPVDYTQFGVNSQTEFLNLFEPGSLDPFIVEGKVYTGGLSEFNTFSLLYNAKHFEDAGLPLPPKDQPLTWEELATFAEKLSQFDANGNRTRAGIALVYNVPIWTVLIYEPMVHQLGGQLIDSETGQPDFASEQMVKAMQYVQDLRFKYKAIDPAFSTDLLGDFANDRSSVIIAGPWALSLIRNLNPDIDVRVAPLPVFEGGQRTTTLYAWAWFVSSKSAPEKQKLAWEFVNLLSSKGQSWWDNVRYLQSRIGKADTGDDLVTYRLNQEPLLDVFLDDFKYGKFEFRSTSYFELSQIWTRAASRILEGEDVKTVLQEAQIAAGFTAQ
jgi:multiple sugar transport system substrate-binding protein